jgi:hypothetical protein
MPPQSWQKLWLKNAHPRDKDIVFDEPTHIYTIKGSSKGYISCTGFLHAFFGHFDPDAIIKKMMSSPKWPSSKYYGQTAAEIKAGWAKNGEEASGAGTEMHLAIEMFLNDAAELIPTHVRATREWSYFMDFWRDHGADLEPYRMEWEVWVEEIKLAGSIDGIFRRRSDGRFLIYDWKRSKKITTDNKFQSGLGPMAHLPDCNYWHYSLQLNVYRWILETYYGLDVADMYLVIMHPDAKGYKRMRLNRMDDEVAAMVECRRLAVKLEADPRAVPVRFDEYEVAEEGEEADEVSETCMITLPPAPVAPPRSHSRHQKR